MIQKTKVLTLIVFGLLFLNLSAQDDNFSEDKVAKLPDDDRKYRFGLQFSPDISWIKPDKTGYKNDGTKIGFSYGLSFEYFMTKNYLFSTGLTILNTGGAIKYTDDKIPLIEVTEDFKIKYVELPVLLKLRTNEIGYLTYYGQFGFIAGIRFNSKSDLEYNSTTPTVLVTPVANFTDINAMNLSLAIGGGVEYNISGNTTIMLGLTFSNGFVDQLKGDATANLNYVALNIGIYF